MSLPRYFVRVEPDPSHRVRWGCFHSNHGPSIYYKDVSFPELGAVYFYCKRCHYGARWSVNLEIENGGRCYLINHVHARKHLLESLACNGNMTAGFILEAIKIKGEAT